MNGNWAQEGPGQDHTVGGMRSLKKKKKGRKKKKKREKSDSWASDRLYRLGQRAHEWCREFREPQEGLRTRKQV